MAGGAPTTTKMIALYGAGPEARICGECQYFVVGGFRQSTRQPTWTCRLYQREHGRQRTAHIFQRRWPACARFKAVE